MLKSTFEDQLKVLGYDFMQDVVGVRSLADIYIIRRTHSQSQTRNKVYSIAF